MADDDKVLNNELSESLSDNGFDVIQAFTGKDALKLVESQEIDIVFLDIKMPEMDGIEVLRRAGNRYGHPTFIIMTGFASLNTAIQALKHGAFDYVKKPFQVEDLVDIINRIQEERNYLKDRLDEPRDYGIRKKMDHGFLETLKKTHNILLVTGEEETAANPDGTYSDINVLPLIQTDSNKRKITDLFTIKREINNHILSHPRPAVVIDCLGEMVDHYGLDNVGDFVQKSLHDQLPPECRIVLLEGNVSLSQEAKEILSRNAFKFHMDLMFQAISSPIRRDTVIFLSENPECQYSDILRALNIRDSSKLNFHLKRMLGDSLVEKDSYGKYQLSERGRVLANLYLRFERHWLSENEALIYFG